MIHVCIYLHLKSYMYFFAVETLSLKSVVLKHMFVFKVFYMYGNIHSNYHLKTIRTVTKDVLDLPEVLSL